MNRFIGRAVELMMGVRIRKWLAVITPILSVALGLLTYVHRVRADHHLEKVLGERLEHGGQPVNPGDSSRWVEDQSLPDDSTLNVSERRERVTVLENTGTVVWKGRFLERQGRHDGLGLRTPFRIPIPTTKPGQLCLIKIPVQAPIVPGYYRAEFKMIDKAGLHVLSSQSGVFIKLHVVSHRPN